MVWAFLVKLTPSSPISRIGRYRVKSRGTSKFNEAEFSRPREDPCCRSA